MQSPNSSPSVATPAPARRGRPKLHADEAARARAYRRRRKLRDLGKGNTRAKLAAEWNKHSDAKKAFVNECVALTQQIQTARLKKDFDEVVRLYEMLEYTEQIERQRIREERIARSKRPISPNHGVFLHDAPHGCGMLVSGDVDLERVHARNQTHGRRVAPKGHGVGIEDERAASEDEYGFINSVFQDFSTLRCCMKYKDEACLRLVCGIRPEGYCCDLHMPIS